MIFMVYSKKAKIQIYPACHKGLLIVKVILSIQVLIPTLLYNKKGSLKLESLGVI